MEDGSGKQKTVSTLVFVGGSVGVLGLFLVIFSGLIRLGFGMVLGFIMIPIGIILVVVGLGAGWGEAFGDPSKKPVQREMNIYVVAKVVADSKAEPVIDPGFYNPEELRHLVQIRFQNGRKIEFETAPEVFDGIGEGMNGDIVYQGKWLNQFTFRPRAGASEIGEDPFRAGKL